METRIISQFVALLFICAAATSCTRPIDLEAYFASHAQELYQLNDLLLRYPLIRRVNPDLRLQFVEGSDKFDQDTRAAYEEALQRVHVLGIKSVVISRDRRKNGEPLLTVRYVLNRTGIVTSGGTVTGISFVPDAETLAILGGEKDTYTALPEKGWYSYRFVDPD